MKKQKLLATNILGSMMAAFHPSRVGSPHTTKKRRWSKPHQGAQECARRRRQLGLGEFRGRASQAGGLRRIWKHKNILRKIRFKKTTIAFPAYELTVVNTFL